MGSFHFDRSVPSSYFFVPIRVKYFFVRRYGVWPRLVGLHVGRDDLVLGVEARVRIHLSRLDLGLPRVFARDDAS